MVLRLYPKASVLPESVKEEGRILERGPLDHAALARGGVPSDSGG